MSDNLDPVFKELSQRAVISEVAETGSILVKSDSPGRLYESKNLDDLISGSASIENKDTSENFILTEQDILNCYVTLSYIPQEDREIFVDIRHAPAQKQGKDFSQNSMFKSRIEWVGFDLEDILVVGDSLTITYFRS